MVPAHQTFGAAHSQPQQSGPEKGVITKGVFSQEESQASLKSLFFSLESVKNVQVFLCFQESGGSLEFLESLKSLEYLESEPFAMGPVQFS